MKIVSNKTIAQYEDQLRSERSKNALLTISIQRQSQAFEVVSLIAFGLLVAVAVYVYNLMRN